MRLTKRALKAIKTQAKTRIALAFGCSVYTVDRWIKENEKDSDLTKPTAVRIISEETNLTADQILEESSKKTALR